MCTNILMQALVYLILLTAIRAYQQIGDIAMVTSLQQIQVHNGANSQCH